MAIAWEGDTTPEMMIFGACPKVTLPLDAFILMPQIRAGMNPELPALVESIRTHQLINTVDVACLNADEMIEYARFVDETWDTPIPKDAIWSRQQADGCFYLLVAGHSRYEAVSRLQVEDPGRKYAIEANLRDLHTPAQIIAHQMDENIHSQPSQERRAIAVVELYNFGRRTGMWTNKVEFLRQNQGKISKRVLNEALGFSDLPDEARSFVFARKVPYTAAVVLGQSAETVMDFVIDQMGIDPVDATYTDSPFAEAYRWRIGIIFAHICNDNLNGPAAKKYVLGQIGEMRRHLDRKRQAAESGLEMKPLDFAFMSPEEQSLQYRQKLLREYNAALREMEERSVASVDSAMRLHAALLGQAAIQTFKDEKVHRLNAFGGSVAMSE